ncbi:hypothetical protein PO124_10680 [Bacillus licheniformis]|nr:hypothetical protein [Bacillus licheniformis]
MFGSEIKAILAHPEVKAKVDRSGLAEISASARHDRRGAVF